MKAVRFFGRAIPLTTFLAVLTLAGLATASVLTYFAKIEGTVTVKSAITVLVDDQARQDAPAEFTINLGQLQAGDVNTLDTKIYVKNNANREVFVNYVARLPKNLVDGSNSISFSYVETDENGNVVEDARYDNKPLEDTLVIDPSKNTITSKTFANGKTWNNALECGGNWCTFNFAEVIEPSIIYGKATVEIYDITFDLKHEAKPGDYTVTLEILPVE